MIKKKAKYGRFETHDSRLVSQVFTLLTYWPVA